MISIPSIGSHKKTSPLGAHQGDLPLRFLLKIWTCIVSILIFLIAITAGCARYRPTLLINYTQEGKKITVERIIEGDSPSWSPDGKKIVFRDHDGIWILDLESKHQIFVSPLGSHPSWSPDGKNIAYAHKGICLWDIETGNSNSLSPVGNHPKWFPDSDALIFQHQGIWQIHVDGSNKKKVLDQGIPLSFAPDGTSLLIEFWDLERIHFFLAILNLSTGQLSKLVDGTKGSFSPDGYSVVYSQDGIWIYSSIKKGSTGILLDGYHPVWSPAGDKIVFTAQGFIWVMDAPYKTINQGESA